MKFARTACFSALVLGLSACNWGDSAADHLAQANQYLAGADYTSAIIELKNALQLDNESAEARYLLGVAYLETGDMASAQKELERAQQLGWPDSEIRPALAQALLAQGEFTRVREISSRGLASEQEASVLASQAMAALAEGDTWEAQEQIDKALLKAPDSTDVLMASARLLASNDDLEGATAALDKVISLDPKRAPAWSLRGDILAGQKDFTGALAAYGQSISLQQKNFGDQFKQTLLNLQLGNVEAAQAGADQLLTWAPQHPGASYIQGLLHYQGGRYAAAISSLAVTEPAFQHYPLALFFLGSANLVQGNMDQAANLAARFHKLAPDSVQGRKLLATIRLQEGKDAAVQTLLQPVLESAPDDVDALNLTANALLRMGKTDEGIALLSRVATLQPDSPVAQVRLGAGLLIAGQEADATQHMETALELNPEFQQADILLVLNQLQKRDFPAAIKAAEAYQRRHLTSITPHNLLGKVYQEAGQPDAARASYQRALTLDAGDPAANHNLAQMALASNDLAAARKHYEAILAAHEDAVPAMVQLALLDARQGNEASLVAHLEQAMAAAPTELQPRLLLARYYLGKGKAEQVAPLFSSLDAQLQKSPDVLQVLAMAQLSSKDAGAAQFTLEQLLESAPDSAPIRHMMAMAATVSGDNKRAEQELQRALALDENYLPSRIALARLALATGSIPEFETQLEKLTALAADNPDVLLLQAASAQRAGNKQNALKLAEKAFVIAPSTATVVAVASYQEAAGDQAAALERYRVWLDKNPDDITARMAFANTLQLAGRLDDASQQYAAVLEADPVNVIALNNQAWILREKDSAQALEYARRAAELAPDSADVLDTLAMVEYASGNYARAQRSIERALKKHPNHPSMLYHSAMIAAALEDKAAARATLKKLLATHTDFAEIAEAEALAGKLGD